MTTTVHVMRERNLNTKYSVKAPTLPPGISVQQRDYEKEKEGKKKEAQEH